MKIRYLVVLCVLLAPLAQAHATSIFTPESIKKAMLDLYCMFPDQPADAECRAGTPGAASAKAAPDFAKILDPREAPKELTDSGKDIWKLTSAEQKIWALELFDQILAFDPDQYNETMSDLAQDYYAYPHHRAAIELLLSMFDVQRSAGVHGKDDITADSLRERLREELDGRRRKSNVRKVLDRAFTVFVYGSLLRGAAVGPYKAFKMWRSSGEGLSRMKQMQQFLHTTIDGFKYNGPGVGIKGNVKLLLRGQFKSVLYNFLGDKRVHLLAAGSAWGVVDIVLESFRTIKVDPRHVLEPVQELILEDAGREAAFARDELKAMLKESDDELRLHTKAYRERATAIDKDVTRILQEVGHLYEVAAQYRPRMEPIAEDLAEIRQMTKDLFVRLKKADLLNILNGDNLDDKKVDGGTLGDYLK